MQRDTRAIRFMVNEFAFTARHGRAVAKSFISKSGRVFCAIDPI
jgi:hypothetical protein